MPSPTRILHFHDQCSIAKNLCKIGKERGESWFRIPRLPEHLVIPSILGYVYGVASEITARALAFSYSSTLHVHGGHLHEFCRRTSIDYVLHLHGSEVRRYSASGVPFLQASPGTIYAIRKAKKVVYSTPDLAPFVLPIRPDALWMPAPLDRSNVIHDRNGGWFSDVFFPHAWNDSKGLDNLRKVVTGIRDYSTGSIRFTGLRLGNRLDVAHDLGFKLVQPSNRVTHIQRMIGSKVVLGQGHGMFGATDLEALAHDAPLISFPMEENYARHYGLSKADQPSLDLETTVRTAAEISSGKLEYATSEGHKIILRHHSDEAIYRRLLEVYEA